MKDKWIHIDREELAWAATSGALWGVGFEVMRHANVLAGGWAMIIATVLAVAGYGAVRRRVELIEASRTRIKP